MFEWSFEFTIFMEGKSRHFSLIFQYVIIVGGIYKAALNDFLSTAFLSWRSNFETGKKAFYQKTEAPDLQAQKYHSCSAQQKR